MNNFIYVFVVCILLLAVIIALSVILMHRGEDSLSDNEFRDEKGRHVYYDRSSIKKDEFMEENPGVARREMRSFHRLFNIQPRRKKR